MFPADKSSSGGKPDLNSILAMHPGIEIVEQPTGFMGRLGAIVASAATKAGEAAHKVALYAESRRREPSDDLPLDEGWVDVSPDRPRQDSALDGLGGLGDEPVVDSRPDTRPKTAGRCLSALIV